MPTERVHLCQFLSVDNCNYGSLSRLCLAHPVLGEDLNLNCAQVCARDLRRAQWPKKCHQQSVGKTGPSLPAFCYYFTDTSRSLPHPPLSSLSGDATKAVKNPFLASNLANMTHGSCLLRIPSLSASHCLSFCLTLPLGHQVEGSLPQSLYLTSSEEGLCHPFSVLYLSHGCSTPFSSLSARSGASLSSSDLVCESSPLPIQHLDRDLCLPFSCSNFASGHSRPSTFDSSPFPQGLCHRSACETFSLAIANLSLKKGSPKTPFSTSNCVIRCHDWLRISHSLGLSPFREGFCQQTSYLSVACGGTIPLLEFWNSSSSTFCLSGSLAPLHSSNCVSVCKSLLYIGSGAETVVGLDDSSRSPLPNICIHSMYAISAPLPSHLLTSAWSIGSIMGSRCCVGLDDLSRSPLPFACTFSILAFLMLCFTTCILSIDFSMSSRSSEGLSASQRCTLPLTCTSFAHVFYLFLSFVDLTVADLTMKSSVLPTLLWLLAAIISFIFFAAKLWHCALALVGRCHVSLCQIGLFDLCHSLLLSDSLCDSDGSLRATCALLRHDFFAFILGRVIRTQPLPDNSMTIGEFQDDAHTWASDIEFEEINSTNPFLSSNSPHSLSDCDFATACTFTPLSTHVFTHLSRPMKTVFCHLSLTPGQRTAFCLLGGLLQTRLPLPNEFISKSPLALLFEHSSITTSSTAKLSLVLLFR